MSILNVNQIQPVGSGQTVTISAANITASSSTISASSFVGGVTVTSGNLTGISSVSTTNLTVNGNAYPTAGSLSNRNIVINGAMQVAQRGTTSTTSGYYTVDRWSSDTNISVTQSQQSLSSGDPYNEGLRYFYRNAVNSTSSASNSYMEIVQHIETTNFLNFGWNYTSNTSYVTCSFWARSSLSGTYYVSYYNQDSNLRIAKEVTLSANTWKKVTHTIPGNASLVMNDDKGRGLSIYITPHYGTDYTGSSAQLNTWFTVSSSEYFPDFSQNWGNTASATFDITGVQLEVGTVATPFEHRSYGDELARCQRYYYKLGPVGSSKTLANASADSATAGWAIGSFPVTMRTSPTALEQSGTASDYVIRTGGGSRTCSAVPTFDNATTDGWMVALTVASGQTAGQAGFLRAASVTTAYLAWSAEL